MKVLYSHFSLSPIKGEISAPSAIISPKSPPYAEPWIKETVIA